MTDSPSVIAIGSHILDTLVRPVEVIPDGQRGALVEQIAMTAAGGTPLVLSKLGGNVRSAGAVSTDHLAMPSGSTASSKSRTITGRPRLAIATPSATAPSVRCRRGPSGPCRRSNR